MRIALFTHRFAPDFGGIQTMSQLLAREFTASGHDVVVVTHSPARGLDDSEFPFEVLRQPGPRELLRAVRSSDVVFHNNITLQFVWPLILVRRPWVVAVRTWIRRNDGSMGIRDRLKHQLLRFASVISISGAIADHLSTSSTIIPNSYRDDIFRRYEDVVRRPSSIVAVGRLVDSKGFDLLLGAVARLKEEGLTPEVTIVGDGPERDRLERLVADLQIGSQVAFAGYLSGEALARELSSHEFAVIPSRWAEPFGVVGLELIGAGCVPVASAGGGLPDAVGDCGLLFPNGDQRQLELAITRLLSDRQLVESLQANHDAHLASHTAARMGQRYLAVIESATR